MSLDLGTSLALERLLSLFQTEIRTAAQFAAKHCDVERDDLEMYAVERILAYAQEPGTYARDEVLVVAGTEDERGLRGIRIKVQRALNCDLLNYAKEDRRQRGLIPLGPYEATSLEEMLERGQDIPSDHSHDNAAERSPEMSDWLYQEFPLLKLHYYSGFSIRDIAEEYGLSVSTVHKKIAQERERFIRWAFESGQVDSDTALTVLLAAVPGEPASPRARPRRKLVALYTAGELAVSVPFTPAPRPILLSGEDHSRDSREWSALLRQSRKRG